MKSLHIQRKGLADLVGGDAKALSLVRIDVEKRQGMDQIQPVLARRDKADPGPRLAPDPLVHLVGMGKRLGRKAFVIDHPRFHLGRSVDKANVHPPFGHFVPARHKAEAMGVAVDHAGRLDRILHRFQTDPQPGITAERPAIEPVIHDLLHARRGHNRHVRIHQRPFGLVQHGRGFAGVVIAHGHDDAAMFRRTRHVGMFEHVARAVHARSLAIPQAEHTVVFAFAAQLGLLAAPQGGGGQVLVQPRLKCDVMGGKLLERPAHLYVDRTQRRTAISRDQTGGVQPGGHIARLLHQHQPHQRLRAVQKDRTLVQIIAVVQGNLLRAHAWPPLPRSVLHIFRSNIGHYC